VQTRLRKDEARAKQRGGRETVYYGEKQPIPGLSIRLTHAVIHQIRKGRVSAYVYI
jgi:hypothetical protein